MKIYLGFKFKIHQCYKKSVRLNRKDKYEKFSSLTIRPDASYLRKVFFLQWVLFFIPVLAGSILQAQTTPVETKVFKEVHHQHLNSTTLVVMKPG